MSEEQPTYKVTDRRLFNPDGSPREVPPEERPAPAPPVASEPPPIAEPATASERKAEATPVAEATSPEPPPESSLEDQLPEEESELPGAEDPSSFASFMMSIA